MKVNYNCDICDLHFDDFNVFNEHVKEYHPDAISLEQLLPKIVKIVEMLTQYNQGFNFSKN
jgi:hypothetical protein